jgi:hypothetical protein
VANAKAGEEAAHGASDNGTGIRVTDDLPRPLPVLRGEAEIMRMLLGEQLRTILFGEEKP